jgi:hypothetical protein
MVIKDMLKEIVAGLAIFIGNDFNEDDIVYISGRKARINRVGLRKTVFIMLDVDPHTKWPVMNHRLQGMNIEKTLPTNGTGEIKADIKKLQERVDELEDCEKR